VLHCGLSLNGVPACASKKLLTQILRTEWSFAGYVVSDDDALEFIISDHHYVNDTASAAAAAVQAGCNLELTDQPASNRVFPSIRQVRLPFRLQCCCCSYNNNNRLTAFVPGQPG